MSEKILIVDDDAETLRLVGLMLQRQGYQVVSASNGAQAIQMVIAEKPNLVILDVMMPDIDGFQVTQQLRANPETAYVSILMFTAKSQVEDKVVGYEAGVDDYLTKPIHPAELTAHVRSLLARGKTRPGGAKSDRGYTLGVIAPRGGMGASSLVLNLGIALHTATNAEVVDGKYTGKVINTACYQQGKLVRLEQWLAGREVTESWAYSDSINDRFLLEYADHAIAVNPDARLQALAEEQGWDVQDWSI